ncbi:hypothetical protein ACH5RR_020603 [Cinchona calisaya]|uniref:UDP-glycosyltransferase 87A1 n=1 Tax=Cinchona calisaya TaxID=153742 RepID=A0ABD2ZFY3_9GENT
MDPSSLQPIKTCHVVAMPFPGRGHVNPMMNFCKHISMTRPTTTLITFIVTEEWHGFISSDPRPANIRLVTIPNVIPSEIGRAKDWAGFIRASLTKLEAPVEELLDRLEPPKPNVIVHDTFLKWMVDVGNRRNIPVASFWTQSATAFSIFHHFDLFVQNGHFNVNLTEKGKEQIEYIPGVPKMRISDLPTPFFSPKGQEVFHDCMECIWLVPKAQFLLLTSTYELETQVIDGLQKEFVFPIYSIGPAIPYFNLNDDSASTYVDQSEPEYVKWLDAQPTSSVLYISQGSFLSVSNVQLDEIVAGVHDSGVRFFWVTREDLSHNEKKGDTKAIIVPWCDQLRVLSHSSIGGFWSHCGWNSTKEAIFSGLPMLSFPIFWDQTTNTKQIVEDWKIGWRVKKDDGSLITRQEIARLLQKFMDSESDEGKEMRRRAKELQVICQKAAEKGGS